MQSSTQQMVRESAPGTARDGQKETQNRWKVGKGSKSGKWLVYADEGGRREILAWRFDSKEKAQAFADEANRMRCR